MNTLKVMKIFIILPDVIIEMNYVIVWNLKQQLIMGDAPELKITQKNEKKGNRLNTVWYDSY